MVGPLKKEGKALREMWTKDQDGALLLLLWSVQGTMVGITYPIIAHDHYIRLDKTFS